MFKLRSILCIFCAVSLKSVIFITAETATQCQPLKENECSCSCPKTSYVVSSFKVGWFNASIACKQLGMELASIIRKEEQAAVEQYIKSGPHHSGYYNGSWLDGTRYGAAPNDFVWFNTGKPLVYRKFAPGQPDNSANKENCLQLYMEDDGHILWNDISCEVNLYFICQSTKCS